MAGHGRFPFDWTDPFLLEQELSEDERMVRDNARRFCQAKLSPRARDDFRYERFDRGVMAAMGEMGFLRRDPSGGRGRRGAEQRCLWADRA